MDVRVHQAEERKDIQIVEIEGRIDAHTAPEVEKALSALLDTGVGKIIIDFAQVNYISSGGLRVFLTALKQTRANNGDLKLVNLIPNVEKIFKLAGFTKIFNILSDVASAVKAF